MSTKSAPEVPEWTKDAIFYQIFPDRFARHAEAPDMSGLEGWEEEPTVYGFKGGTLRGIEERLDYLADLGITALYLNPIFQSAANHRYHTFDYLTIDPILGTKEDFRSLLSAAHARDIKVILDGVFNHVGRGFFQFNHVLENGKASPYVDWFHFNPEHLEDDGVVAFPQDEHHRKLGRHGGTYDILGYRAWADLAPLPKLNTDNPEVREFLLQVAEYWIKEGIDGWRLDVPNEIDDPPFWREFRRRVREINPEAYIVGEIWTHAPEWLQGDRFDALMNYPFSRFSLGFFGGERLDTSFTPGGFSLEHLDSGALVDAVEEHLRGYEAKTNLVQLNLLGSHDTARFRTLLAGDAGRAGLATLFLFLLPGAPCIYYGDEIGLEGGDDPACRAGFPWERREEWNLGLLELTKAAITLRREHPAVRRGEYAALPTERAAEREGVGNWNDQLVVARWNEEELVLGLFNRAAVAAEMILSVAELRGRFGELGEVEAILGLSGADGAALLEPSPPRPKKSGERLRLTLPPLSGRLYAASRS